MSEYTPEEEVPVEHQKPPALLLSNRTYDLLKLAVQYFLPAVVTLWLTLANIWNWPNSQEIGASIGALNVALGVVLAVSTRAYNKSDARFDGHIDVFEKGDGTKSASLVLKNYEDPADVVKQKEVTFRVNQVE